jgi:hypothetical protein
MLQRYSSDELADDDVLPLSRHSPNLRQDLKGRSIRPQWLLSSYMRAFVSARLATLLEGIVRRLSVAEQADQAGKILPHFRAIEGERIVTTD